MLQHLPSRIVLAATLAVCSLVGQATPVGPDRTKSGSISGYLTQDISPLLSMIGIWNPTGASGADMVDFWGVVRLGPGQLQGIMLSCWAYSGFDNAATEITPTAVALLAQQADGTLTLAGDQYLSSPMTNGAGSVLVADFNGDGKDDLFLAAHNESPFVAKASTAYLSKADSTFSKVTLTDSVMAHGANVAVIAGKPTVLAATFSTNPIYTYNGQGGFNVNATAGQVGSLAAAAADFLGNGGTQIVYASATSGPGYPFTDRNVRQQMLWRYENERLVGAPVPLPAPYFNDKPQYSPYPSYTDPVSKTNNSRVWTDDINHDGKPDIVVGAEIWSPTVRGQQKSVLQLLVNQGGGQFRDRTDELNPGYDQNSTYDYSLRMADVDQSGINTYFMGQPALVTNDKHGNYILVNDGTGRFHVAMHDEFVRMGDAVIGLLVNQFRGTDRFATGQTPGFIAYQTPSGLINFVAKQRIGEKFVSAAGIRYVARQALVNVPVGINLATDFTTDITIPNRNGSKRIRTFAGNDTIHRAVSDPDCAIDGGLGSNTAVYPGRRADWLIARHDTVVTIRPVSGAGGTDSLTRIQLARFDDQVVDLATLPPSAVLASVVEYYNASLDHYFITWVAGEIATLDAGITTKGWVRTNKTFKAHPVAQVGTSPVCRFYMPPDKGDSHFFGRGAAECDATGQNNPSFVLESSDFMQVYLPTIGVCPATTTPVYRVFSNRPDANHRYMTDKATRDQMVQKGWLAEGDGPDLVVMCAPQ